MVLQRNNGFGQSYCGISEYLQISSFKSESRILTKLNDGFLCTIVAIDLNRAVF